MSPLATDDQSHRRFASRWIRLGDPPPDALADARLQLQWAVQLLAAFAGSFVTRRPDDSHLALTWSPERRAFLSDPTADGSGLRLGLAPGGLSYRLFAPGPSWSDPFVLQGRTLAEATAWLVGELDSRLPEGARGFQSHAPDIPGHRVGRGAAFDARPDEMAELERWFHDASLLLEAVSEAEEGASAVRCWPHRFDISVLIDVTDDEGSAGGDPTRSIAAGMAPGDEVFSEPYFYVSPWPYPDAADLPDLQPPSIWHVEDWVGAVLSGPKLVEAGDELAQANRAASFARAAIAGCRALLRRPIR